MGAAFALIHHASKGNQSAKSVTDVGAGAGAQSRATDTHLVLRPHEEKNAVVLDAAARSWPPIAPICLRWEFPLWKPASDLDPTALRPDRPSKKKAAAEEPSKPPEPVWTPKRFADTFGKPEPRPRAVVLEEAQTAGLSDRKAERLLSAAIGCGYLHDWKEAGANSRTMIGTAPPPEHKNEPPKTAKAKGKRGKKSQKR
jgi:hypothetical protein